MKNLKIFAAIIPLTLSAGVNAAVVQYDFNGVVSNDFNSQINLAETFTLSFLVDTETPGIAINDYIQYEIISGAIDFSGGYSGSFGGGQFRVTNNNTIGLQTGYDIIKIYTYPYYDVSGMPNNYGSDFNNLQLQMWDSTGTVLTDGSIPVSLNSSDWDGSDGNILWNTPTLRHNDLVVSGVSVGASVVPIPAAVWLFGSGLLGLIGVGARRRT